MGVQLTNERPGRMKRAWRRRWVRVLTISVAAVLVAAGAVAYWALDRFVIDDVQIGDVAAFEASARAAASTIEPSSSVQTSSGSAASDARPAATTTTVVATQTADTSPTAPADTTSTTSTTTTTTTMTVTVPAPPMITESSYRSSAMAIEIRKVVTGSGNDQVVYFVADVRLNDLQALSGGFAENKFGANIIENTSAIAQRYNAVWAINGDYYGFRSSGIVIRNGVLFRDDPARTGMVIYADGRAEIYDETATTGQRLLDAGAVQTFSFGPPLVDNGVAVSGIDQIEIDTNFGNHSVQGNHPRSGIGIIAPNHFVFVAVDGRSRGYSRGMTLPQFADLFVELGATEAYNLDGGGSTTMYFNGDLVNNPLGKGRERGTSDVIYLAEPAVQG